MGGGAGRWVRVVGGFAFGADVTWPGSFAKITRAVLSIELAHFGLCRRFLY